MSSSTRNPTVKALTYPALAALMGRPGATLRDVKRFLEDASFHGDVLEDLDDDYTTEFWVQTYPDYPKDAHIPIVNRLDRFLRPKTIRNALCNPVSSFSIREALAAKRIMFFDLSGMAPDSMQLMGQMLLSKFQLELMRREAVSETERHPCYLYADELQTFAGSAEDTWRELLSRGRRYGLALTLAHQHPSQLPSKLQSNIFGNVASLVIFSLSAKDAQSVRHELLDQKEDEDPKPLPLDAIIRLETGRAVTRLGTGAYAIGLSTPKPVPTFTSLEIETLGERVRDRSWSVYGVASESDTPSPAPPKTSKLDDSDDAEDEDFD